MAILNTTLVYAILGGLVPAIFWLIFWLREDKKHPEPVGLIVFTFFLGMGCVFLAGPIQRWIAGFGFDDQTLIILWSAVEEFLKFGAVAVLALKSGFLDEPIDYPMYAIAAALGFAGLENILYLHQPFALNHEIVGLLAGNLRFIGATLLHAIASSLIGIMMGLAFYQTYFVKKLSLIVGFVAAVALHSIFNFFIMKDEGRNVLGVFAFLWVITIISMLLFEKLKRMAN